MNENRQKKWWLKSKSILGIAIMLLPTIAKIAGFDLPAGIIDALNALIQSPPNTELNSSFDSIVQLSGAALAVFGRWTATSELKFKRK